MEVFGVSFLRELEVAGLNGLPFSWSTGGEIVGRENLTTEQNAALDIVIAAHDPAALVFDDLKSAKKAAIEAEGQTRLAAGFAYDFGGTYGTKVLQLRPGTEDRLNWTNALLGYQAQIGAGNGAVDGAFIRTADNTTLQLSYITAATALGAMLTWGASHFQVVWAKKDLVNAATDETELSAISVDTGWPGE